MPYKCNVCGASYAEGSTELRDVMLRGSCSCGKRFLMYLRGNAQQRPVSFEASPEEKIMEPSPYLPQAPPYKPREKAVPKPAESEGSLGWLGSKFVKAGSEEPMFLSIETIKILEDGKYNIDVTSLMGGKPIIVKDANGVYYIDVPHAMRKRDK